MLPQVIRMNKEPLSPVELYLQDSKEKAADPYEEFRQKAINAIFKSYGPGKIAEMGPVQYEELVLYMMNQMNQFEFLIRKNKNI
jgi:hypothetical protein